jgi:hypothetical protein
MSATPMIESYEEFFKLLNLCKEQDIPQTEISALATDSTKWLEFIDKHLSGYVSYLNRSKDPSQFAQVRTFSHFVDLDSDLKNYLKRSCMNGEKVSKPAKSRVNKAKAPKPAKSGGAKRGRPKKSAK